MAGGGPARRRRAGRAPRRPPPLLQTVGACCRLVGDATRATNPSLLNPPPAEAGGFLAQAAHGPSGPTGLTPSTPAGSEPARFGTTGKGITVPA
ncbi:hypothetical protein FNV68_00240 [Streptomyces sp. S1D4-23]|nr:hypothetical protein FNV68_00240 [Streptomyces sp. S1D4-23]